MRVAIPIGADWILSAGGRVPLLHRSQLVLDLSRPEVSSYLFERMDAILTTNRLLREWQASYLARGIQKLEEVPALKVDGDARGSGGCMPTLTHS